MEAVTAGVVLLLCVLALLRLMLGEPRRRRLDAWLKRQWFATRVQALRLWRWRRLRREADEAARQAIAQAAARAARRGEWTGNVCEPDRFKKPRKPH